MSQRTTPGHVALRVCTPSSLDAQVTELNGRPAVLVTSHMSEPSPLSSSGGAVLAEAAHFAREKGIPLVTLLASTGADIGEGVPALDGWARAAREISLASGIVPLLFGVAGPAVSGTALMLGLADQVVMTAESYAFVSGPTMVNLYTGLDVSTDELGGAGSHSRNTGVASLVAADRDAVLAALADLVTLLPSNADEEPPLLFSADPPDRVVPEARGVVPESATGSYDVRSVIELVVDDGGLLELRAGWAPNLVTGLATLGGRPVGIIGNQPTAIAGTLDIPASQKGARFVAFCDAFNLPLITFVDTPGFYPGKDLEWRGMIRHGAQMAFAYARATVPRLSVTLRKSYGGAYIVMDSKNMGNDLAVAWPSSEIAVMGAKGATEILHRRVEPDARAALEADYEERLLNPYIAAERGAIDMVIDPADTRLVLTAALEAVSTKRELLVARRHDNCPL